MKKLILSAAVVFMGYSANAQLDQGNLLLSGGLNFSSGSMKQEARFGGTTNTQDGPKFTDFNFNAMVGYFVADNLAIGLGIGYGSGAVTEDDGTTKDKYSSSMFSVGPFARYYMPYSDKFSFFADLGVGIGFGSMTFEETTGGSTTSSTTDINALQAGITPGFTYFVSDRIGLDMRIGFIGYSSMAYKDDLGGGDYVKTSMSDFSFGVNLMSISMGLSVFL